MASSYSSSLSAPPSPPAAATTTNEGDINTDNISTTSNNNKNNQSHDEKDRTNGMKNTTSTTTTTMPVVSFELSPMPLLPISSLETINMCYNLPLQSNDIFICSYPKSGTTWTQHIVISLVLKSIEKKKHQNNPPLLPTSLTYNHVSEYAPFYEVDQHWDNTTQNLIPSIQQNHQLLGRRIFNTHLRWNMLPTTNKQSTTTTTSSHNGIHSSNSNNNNNNHPTNKKKMKKSTAKFIYVIRSPYDVCVSFYYHLSNQLEGGYDGTFDMFFHDWSNGQIAFGSYRDHLLSFLPAFQTNNTDSNKNQEDDNEEDDDEDTENVGRSILLITYEEMISNLSLVVTRIAKFIDVYNDDEEEKDDDENEVDKDNDNVGYLSQHDINDLVPTFSFESMKLQLNQFQPKSVTWKNNFQFLRKGITGDSKQLISSLQKQQLQQQWFHTNNQGDDRHLPLLEMIQNILYVSSSSSSSSSSSTSNNHKKEEETTTTSSQEAYEKITKILLEACQK